MNVPNWQCHSLGEWAAICRAWNKAHGGKSEIEPPSEADFEAAIMAARGM
ncbi:hypothetical protein [Rhizobium setariae]|nr:hypothetical protein [Rhizobium setariae]